MSYHMDFAGKIAVVTGGSSGIGLEVSKAFLSHGAGVVNWDIRMTPETERLAREFPDRYRAVVADVTSEDSIRAAAAATLEAAGGVDIVVNCAGIIIKAPIEDIDMDAWDRIYAVNVKGTVMTIKHLTPALKRSKAGRIINISSMTANYGLETYSPYSTTKAAVSNLTKVLALELSPYGITVNALCPGWVQTPMLDQGLVAHLARLHGTDLETARREVLRFVPQHRFIPVEEIAFSVLYLAHPLAQSVSGTELRIDCGLTLTFTPGFHLPEPHV